MKVPDGAFGLILHYAHGEGHPPTQGSLSADDFRRLLDACGERVWPAHKWLDLARADYLGDEIAVTFDDGLREALDVFLPVLEERKLTAFWNVYTQTLVGVPHSLERYRWIRNHAFGSVDAFYERWRDALGTGVWPPSGYLKDYGYLTHADRAFRYWRNELATPGEYERLMDKIAADAKPMLLSHWLSPTDLVELRAAGHIVGLHSHTHSTTMHHLTREQQITEWATSKFVLETILGEPVTTCAWPCGVVTDVGKAWMRAAGITLAWGATMSGDWPYNVPRLSSGYFR